MSYSPSRPLILERRFRLTFWPGAASASPRPAPPPYTALHNMENPCECAHGREQVHRQARVGRQRQHHIQRIVAERASIEARHLKCGGCSKLLRQCVGTKPCSDQLPVFTRVRRRTGIGRHLLRNIRDRLREALSILRRNRRIELFFHLLSPTEWFIAAALRRTAPPPCRPHTSLPGSSRAARCASRARRG